MIQAHSLSSAETKDQSRHRTFWTLCVILLTVLWTSPLLSESRNAEEIPRAERGWLAFGYHLGQEPGSSVSTFLIVHKLVPEGPADSAGLQVGDVVTHIDEETISFSSSLEALNYFARIKPGQKVGFRVRRPEGVVQLELVAQPMPQKTYDAWLGIYERLRDLQAAPAPRSPR